MLLSIDFQKFFKKTIDFFVKITYNISVKTNFGGNSAFTPNKTIGGNISKKGGETTMTNEAPRLRTLPVALAIMKAEDPMTAMNITSLRTLAKTNKISTIKVGKKFLVDYETLMHELKNMCQ